MAIKNIISIGFTYEGDGSTTSFTLDLVNDPYTIPTQTVNWFAEDRKAAAPTGVTAVGTSPSSSAILSGNTVVFTFDTAPAVGVHTGSFFLVF